MRKLLLLVPVLLLAASGVLVSAGTASAGPNPRYECHGGNIPSGTYSSVLISGVCFLPTGSVTVTGNLRVAGGALLDAAYPGPSGLPGALAVQGNVVVGHGAVLFMGCDAALACPTGSTIGMDTIGGSLIGDTALGVVLHSVTIYGSAGLTGGGGGVGGKIGGGKCLGNFATGTPPPVPPLWAADPALANGIAPGVPVPVFSDFEDNLIGGDLNITGLKTCWWGSIRNYVAGSVTAIGNRAGDPDAAELVTNLIGANLTCLDNIAAPQYGDSGGSPNQVGGAAFGQCGFGILVPNGDGGPLTPIAVPPGG